jgi:hypothetical protein
VTAALGEPRPLYDERPIALTKPSNGPSRPAASGTGASWNRNSWGWRVPAAIAGAFVILGIVWGVIALTADEKVVPPKTYVDAEYGFSFQYPGEWDISKRAGSLATGGASISVVDPKGTKIKKGSVDSATVVAASEGTKAQPEPSDAGVEIALAELKAQFPDAVLAERLHRAVVGGKDGWSWTFTYTQTKVPVRVAFYWLIDGKTAYGVSFKASQDHWGANEAIFGGILTSFMLSAK